MHASMKYGFAFSISYDNFLWRLYYGLEKNSQFV